MILEKNQALTLINKSGYDGQPRKHTHTYIHTYIHTQNPAKKSQEGLKPKWKSGNLLELSIERIKRRNWKSVIERTSHRRVEPLI